MLNFFKNKVIDDDKPVKKAVVNNKKVVDNDDKPVKMDEGVVKVDYAPKPAPDKVMTFAQIGALYNKMTDQFIGGVSPQNKQVILNEINTIQTGIQKLIDNGTIGKLGALSLVHAQNVADQMTLIKNQVVGFGTTDWNPKYINDVVRDIQDIVNGDTGLQALAAAKGVQGFQQVSNLLAAPTPFPDTPLQTQTLLQFVADSQSLANRAVALAGTDPNSDAVKELITDIQNVAKGINDYSIAQGGLFSARFNNEFKAEGVFGTASKEMIKGLQTGDAALVNAAGEVMVQNAADVRGNMLATGDVFTPAPNGGIPDHIDTVQVAGQVFNDAVTKLIGGVHPGNQASVINDLNATITGLKNAIVNQDIEGKDLKATNKIINLLQDEVKLVQNAMTPQQITDANAKIGQDTQQILKVVHNNATLTTLAIADDPANPGFVALPIPADHTKAVDTTSHYPIHS